MNWFNVTDKLPEFNKRVLVYSSTSHPKNGIWKEYYNIGIAKYKPKDKFVFGNYWEIEGDDAEINQNFLMWAELPEPDYKKEEK